MIQANLIILAIVRNSLILLIYITFCVVVWHWSLIKCFILYLQPGPALIASPSGPDSEVPKEKDAGVEEMLTAMSGDISDEQMKQNLLSALNKRVPHKDVSSKDIFLAFLVILSGKIAD